MSQIDVIKESIQYEQLLKEVTTNQILKGEYLIRDSHPDMKEILGVEAKATITSKEILGDKVMIEGQLNYTVFYQPKDDVSEGVISNKIHSVEFTEKFANYLDIDSDKHKLICEVESEVEHIEATWMNERKVGIDGILTFKWEIYENGEFEYVKDIQGKEDIQILKNDEFVNSIKGEKNIELIGKSMIKVTMDKPEIDEILKCSMNLHKKEVKLGEDKVYIGCYCNVEILYVGKENKELVVLQDDVYLSKEEEIVGISNGMMSNMILDISNYECSVITDDLGENRIVNLEFLLKGNIKVYAKEVLNLIKDVYSPSMSIEISSKENEIGIIHGMNSTEIVVKDNLYLQNEEAKLEQVISVSGVVYVTDKVVENDKVRVEGVVKPTILYKASSEDGGYYYDMLVEEIPYTTTLELNGAKENMNAIVKAYLESIEVSVEGNSIAIKANVGIWTKVSYKVNKDIIIDILEGLSDNKEKKASISIYVVGSGDTLWDLAKKYGTTIEELLKLNDIDDADVLNIGDKLIIPGRAIF